MLVPRGSGIIQSICFGDENSFVVLVFLMLKSSHNKSAFCSVFIHVYINIKLFSITYQLSNHAFPLPL